MKRRARTIVRKAIKSLKTRLDAVILPAAGLPWPLPPDVAAIVHEYDIRMCLTEARARLAPQPWSEPYASAKPVEGVDLYPWSERTVAVMWRTAFYELCLQ